MIRGIVLGATGAIAFIASAHSADLYRSLKDPVYAPADIWTGFYLGVNGGYASGDDDAVVYRDTTPKGATAPSLKPDGGFGGGQIGYNWRAPGGFKDGPSPWVFGIEADIQGSGLDDSFSGNLTNTVGATDTVKESQRIDYFGTVRARLGFAYGKTLLYGTGGFAYGGVDSHLVINGFNLNSNSAETGWVAGGGIEHKIDPAWSLKVEYQYIDLGSQNITEFVSTLPLTAKDIDARFSTVRLGLNYHFLPSYEPLK